MDFIKLYWIPLLLILTGICILLFRKSSGDNKRKYILYQGVLLASFGIYLLITKMFLAGNLIIISWLLGALVVMGIIHKVRTD
jgi:hypothetical protein